MDNLKTFYFNGYLSERQYSSIMKEINIVNHSLEDHAFKDIILQRYSEYFNLNYCHLADQASEDRLINIHKSSGDNIIVSLYKEKENDCLYKEDSLHHLSATTTLHLDLERWDILKEINPLYYGLSKIVSGFEIISAIHPDLTGLIGLKFDAVPLQQDKVAEHEILSPFFINAYHVHRKLTGHTDINNYFISLFEDKENSSIAFYDSAFRMITSGKKFREILQVAGIGIIEVRELLAKKFSSLNVLKTDINIFSKEFRICCYGINIHIEPVYIEKCFYLKVELSVKSCNPVFTPRETEILLLLHFGYSNKEISDQLDISPETVKRHIYNLFSKTGVRNRTELSHIKLPLK